MCDEDYSSTPVRCGFVVSTLYTKNRYRTMAAVPGVSGGENSAESWTEKHFDYVVIGGGSGKISRDEGTWHRHSCTALYAHPSIVCLHDSFSVCRLVFAFINLVTQLAAAVRGEQPPTEPKCA